MREIKVDYVIHEKDLEIIDDMVTEVYGSSIGRKSPSGSEAEELARLRETLRKDGSLRGDVTPLESSIEGGVLSKSDSEAVARLQDSLRKEGFFRARDGEGPFRGGSETSNLLAMTASANAAVDESVFIGCTTDSPSVDNSCSGIDSFSFTDLARPDF